MLGILASLVFAGAGAAAMASIVMTIRTHAASVARLLADSRSIAMDRDYLVHITGETRTASPIFVAKPRRMPQRAIRRSAERAVPLRAAA